MDTIKQLTELDYKSLIIGVAFVALVYKSVYEFIIWFIKTLGLETRRMRQRREEHELLITTAKNLEALQNKQDEDVRQSIAHDKKIKEDLKNVTDTLIKVKEEVTLMRTQRDNDKLAEYKDKIGQSYRYYNARKYSEEEPIPYWNHMEKEALEGLIKQYESHGGKNSFVHSVVETEMQTWKVIDKE